MPGSLFKLGWSKELAARHQQLYPRSTPGRVLVEHRGGFSVMTEDGEHRAEVSGRFRHDALGRASYPAVGDWVVGHMSDDRAALIIDAVVERNSRFSRKVAGRESDEQVLAANVDIAFLLMSLEFELNTRRLERYLTTAWAGGASPVVVLTKADIAIGLEEALAAVERTAFGTPVQITSIMSGDGVEDVRSHLVPNRTGVLLGASGAGKSSLLNALLGHEYMATNEVRWDGRGRHTTTRRELVPVPGGGVLIDTPGLRELALWSDADDGLDNTFSDVSELAASCRFNDCSHSHEPGCAVRSAVEDGSLPAGRLASYHKLQRELKWIRGKQDARARAEQKRRHKLMTKAYEAGVRKA